MRVFIGDLDLELLVGRAHTMRCAQSLLVFDHIVRVPSNVGPLRGLIRFALNACIDY